MFTHHLKIRLHHTDATGVLFFGAQFQLAMDALEEFLLHKGFSLKTLYASPYFFPVVHAESDYLAPLVVGDELEITLKVVKIGTSSVTFHHTLQNRHTQVLSGRVEVVHVLVDRETRTPVPLPDFLREIFESEAI